MLANKNKNPGCLSIFTSLFNGNKEITEYQGEYPLESDIESQTDAILVNNVEILPYRLRDDFLSHAEFSFYKVLSSLIGTHLIIQSKVRLSDIFFVSHPNENVAYFNRISLKHLDFLVCDSTTMKPLFGIELDDSSHKKADRVERDEFVDRVFQTANLPLLHISTQREYSTREIAALIAPLLKDDLDVPVTMDIEKPDPDQPVDAPSQTKGIPLCPKCGIPMVVRTVSKGEHKGEKFYGCKNYPKCREMKPYNTLSY